MEKINYRATSDSPSYNLTKHEGPLDPNLIVDCLYANVPQELRVKRRKEQQEFIDKVNEIKNIVDKDIPEDLIKIVAGVCNHSNNGYHCCARISKAVIDAGYIDKNKLLDKIREYKIDSAISDDELFIEGYNKAIEDMIDMIKEV